MPRSRLQEKNKAVVMETAEPLGLHPHRQNRPSDLSLLVLAPIIVPWGWAAGSSGAHWALDQKPARIISRHLLSAAVDLRATVDRLGPFPKILGSAGLNGATVPPFCIAFRPLYDEFCISSLVLRNL